MMKIKVRKARLDDIPSIRNLIKQHWPSNIDYRKEVGSRETVLVIAESSDDPKGNLLGVGLMRITRWNKTGYLLEFAVDKAHKRMGIGSLLMNTLSKKAIQKGLRAIIVETQPDSKEAIDFYLGYGLRLCGYNDRYYTNNPKNSHQIAVFFSLDL
jgi:ribosomal-protein-alanine N-acetyltransferase